MKTVSLALALAATLNNLASATPIKGKGVAGKFPGWKLGDSPFYFTSTYHVVATPDQVINGTTSTPGEPGAIGYYNYGINSDLDVICFVSDPTTTRI